MNDVRRPALPTTSHMPQEDKLRDLKVDDLKSVMRAFGLSLTGKKDELRARLLHFFSDPQLGARVRASVSAKWESKMEGLKAMRFSGMSVFVRLHTPKPNVTLRRAKPPAPTFDFPVDPFLNVEEELVPLWKINIYGPQPSMSRVT